MAKKKKKKNNSKAQYDAKKKSVSAAAKSSQTADVKKEEILNEDISVTKEAAEVVEKLETAENRSESEQTVDCPLPAVADVIIPYDPDFSEEDFSASVSDLKAEDIKMPDEKDIPKTEKKKLSKVANITQLALLFICGSVALVCLFMLGKNIWGKIKGEEIYSNTHFDGFTLNGDEDTDSRALAKIGSDAPLLTLFDRINAGKSAVNEDTGGKYSEQLARMKASLSALKAQNEDIYGWIYVEGTNINHPVVRCDDNNFYLTHAHTKEYLPIGAIFADLTTADLVTDNYNTVIYGHNVVTVAGGQSSMFHDVEEFLDPEFFKSTNIYIYTMDGVFIFKPVAIYDTVAEDFYFKTVFSTEDEFLSFAKEKISKSNIYSDETFSSGDKMLTLSTCTNGAENGRYALHAKLIEIIK